MILEYKGIPIFYEDEGKGSAIVLLHGFLENSSMWKNVKKTLIKSSRIISIDLLGHGQTGCLGYVHTMEEMAEAVNEVLKSLRVRRVVFIGHSMGGYVSLAFAEKYPKKVKGICLMNSTAKEDSDERREIRTRANKMAQNNYENMVKISISNLFQPENLEVYKKEVQEIKQEALRTPLQGYMAAQEGMKIRSNREFILRKKNFLSLYIIGKNDPILNAESVLSEAKQNHSLSQVLDGGHMSHIENTQELKKVLTYFIRSI